MIYLVGRTTTLSEDMDWFPRFVEDDFHPAWYIGPFKSLKEAMVYCLNYVVDKPDFNPYKPDFGVPSFGVHLNNKIEFYQGCWQNLPNIKNTKRHKEIKPF